MPATQTTLPELAYALRLAAAAASHRRILCLSGDAEWCHNGARAVVAAEPDAQTLWCSRQAPAQYAAIDNGQARQQLGGELDLLIYDAHDGFDADAFGALCGLIRGGGLLILLTPPLQAWPQRHDAAAARFFESGASAGRFLRRFIRIVQASPAITLVQQGLPLPEPPPSPPPINSAIAASLGPCRTADQAAAVEAVIRVAKGHRRRPAVLISDRGRGKSAALGIAVARLFEQGLTHILISAPRLDAVAPVFEHAARLLPQADLQRGRLSLGQARLEFIAPDLLISTAPAADLLLIDEAAAIPAPMLEALLSQHARIVFATTVHGYEGTGRGFDLRFDKILDQRTPGWHRQRLETPIRWAANDPLEAFVFDALLLDAAIAADQSVAALDLEQTQIVQADRDALLENEALLAQLFGLLVLAHYRTRPNDLRQLLDSEAMTVYLMICQGHLLGALLLLAEGGLDAELSKAVYLGRRRLHGHLIPQSLAAHGGLPAAAQLRYGRIMRIAVHPRLQGHGLGSRLVEHVATHVTGVDLIGCSFGLNQPLFRFWQRAGFVPARLGLTREQSSASHALIMLRPVSEHGVQLCRQAAAQQRDQLPLLLADALADFDAALAALLLQRDGVATPELSEEVWRDLLAFAFADRGYEFCIAPITAFIQASAVDDHWLSQLDSTQRALLIGKVLQKQSWASLAHLLKFSGRAALIKAMRNSIACLLPHYCPGETLARLKASFDL